MLLEPKNRYTLCLTDADLGLAFDFYSLDPTTTTLVPVIRLNSGVLCRSFHFCGSKPFVMCAVAMRDRWSTWVTPRETLTKKVICVPELNVDHAARAFGHGVQPSDRVGGQHALGAWG
jgi:hypothetical protein